MRLRTKIFVLLAVMGAVALPSCNTVSGIGRDVQKAGEGIEKTGQGRTW